MSESYIFRSMQNEDLPQVMLIENRAYSHPWSQQIFLDSLATGYYCRLLLMQDELLGYAVMSTGAGEGHILNICIDPKKHKQGYGRILLHRMTQLATSKHLDTLFLEVRVSNQQARYLYESEGFNEIGYRRGYYPAENGREDALVFAKVLPEL